MLRRVVHIVVHADDDGEVLALGRSRNDHFFRARLDVLASVLGLGEPAGGLDDHLDPEVPPGQGRRVTFGDHLDEAVADFDPTVGGTHRLRQRAQRRIVLEQMRKCLVVGKVVHCNDLYVVTLTSLKRPPEVAADTAEAVDTYSRNHVRELLYRRCIPLSQ